MQESLTDLERLPVYTCHLTAHDFLFYVSHEPGKEGLMKPFLHNTALLYAINRATPQTQRNASGSKPHYQEDFGHFRTYVTPAGAIEHGRHLAAIGRALFGASAPQPIKISYNAVDEWSALTMEKDRLVDRKLALPKFGAYHRLPPLAVFRFFAVGGLPCPVIRIGKKLVPARIAWHRARKLKFLSGSFRPSHPVNILDLPKETTVISGKFESVPPSPLLVSSQLKGKFWRIDDKPGPLYVAAFDSNRYPAVG